MFKNEYPTKKIGLSKFAELRPPYVKSITKIPHNVCCCLLHENMRYALQAIIKADSSLFATIQSGSNMHVNFVCEEPLNDCFENKCMSCKDMTKFNQLIRHVDDFNFNIQYQEWCKPVEKSYANIVRVTKTDSCENVLRYISTIRSKFTAHAMIKINQSMMFKKQVITARENPNVAVLQVDFSENYACFNQDETQAAHFGQNHLSILTAAIWTEEMRSLAIVSDVNDHTKNTVLAYVTRLLETISDVVKELNIWSDNATSQFKNKVIISALRTLEMQYDLKITWNFFAAMHGKEAVDGIGAAVKRIARNKVKAGATISNAQEFCNVVCSSSVNVILMTNDDIKQRNIELGLTKLINNAKNIPNISKNHFFGINGKVFSERITY
jgi:hypothetical protein